MKITYKSIALSVIFLSCLVSRVSSQQETEFLHHGFLGANLLKFGSSKIHPSGLLELTNTSMRQMGQAFHGFPIPFIGTNSSKSKSFSTSFVFAIIPGSEAPGHGLAFVISPSLDFRRAFPSNYLGLFNTSNNGDSSNRILAVEFDTVQSVEMHDPDDNHLGIDVNGVISIETAPAAYFDDREMKNISLRLANGEPIRVWIEYNATEMTLNVTVAPLDRLKPSIALMSRKLNLSDILSDNHFIGVTASTGTIVSTHCILGWSFSLESQAKDFDITKLPSLPLPDLPQPSSPSPNPPVKKDSSNKKVIIIGIIIAIVITILGLILFVSCVLHGRGHTFRAGPRNFSYQTISRATGGFNNGRLLGEGNTGNFYRGQLPTEGMNMIAVKRITCGTRQQRDALIAQVDTMFEVRHRNLVNLLGYSRHGSDVYLIYDYIPNGSLDRFLFGNDRPPLLWSERFNIIRGIAYGLRYLHNECSIIHGNIKSSNAVLDAELQAKLCDFGQGNTNNTTGHMAPELVGVAVPTREGDVFSLGVLILEIVCGRKAIQLIGPPEETNIIHWVLQRFTNANGNLLECCDIRINREHLVISEVLLTLRLGLMCSHQLPQDRPDMRRVVQYLEGSEDLPHDNVLFNAVQEESQT